MGREEVFGCELLYDMMLLSIDIHTLDYLRQKRVRLVYCHGSEMSSCTCIHL